MQRRLIFPVSGLIILSITVLLSAQTQDAFAQAMVAGGAGAGRSSDMARMIERLHNSLRNDPELRQTRVLRLERTADGTVRLSGLIANESLRSVLESQSLKILQREDAAGNLKGPFNKVDADRMIPLALGVATPLDCVAALERALPESAASCLRVERYDVGSRRLGLCGFVENEAAKQDWLKSLVELEFVSAVDMARVMVADELAFSGSTRLLYRDALDGLRPDAAGRGALPATAILRRRPELADVWYILAANHLLQGDRVRAAGDLRVAAALDGTAAYTGGSRRCSPLSRFQGPLRLELERLVAEGNAASVCYPANSQR